MGKHAVRYLVRWLEMCDDGLDDIFEAVFDSEDKAKRFVGQLNRRGVIKAKIYEQKTGVL